MSAPPGKERLVRALKKREDIDNPFAVAWAIHNRGGNCKISRAAAELIEETMREQRQRFEECAGCEDLAAGAHAIEEAFEELLRDHPDVEEFRIKPVEEEREPLESFPAPRSFRRRFMRR